MVIKNSSLFYQGSIQEKDSRLPFGMMLPG
jgi:hypothetical protein